MSWAALFKNKTSVNAESDDVIIARAAEKLIQRHMTSWEYVPRGLINNHQKCYVHVIIQALISVVELPRSLLSLVELTSIAAEDSFPVVRGVVKFLRDFTTSDTASRKAPSPIIPIALYDVLQFLPVSSSGQQDADEFFNGLLNRLHEELAELSVYAAEHAAFNDCSQSLITSLFQGRFCIRLTKAGNETSANYETFFSVHLNIDDVSSVNGSLCKLFQREKVDGLRASGNKIVSGWQQRTVESLPTILVLSLHQSLHQGVGNGDGSSRQNVQYSLDLNISRKYLSGSEAAKGFNAAYKLFAVILHHGTSGSSGHYTANVLQARYGQWVRCDDHRITPLSKKEVLNPVWPTKPFMLMYRRLNAEE